MFNLLFQAFNFLSKAFKFLFKVFDVIDFITFFGVFTGSNKAEKQEQEAWIKVNSEKVKAAELKRVMEEEKWLCKCGFVNIKHASECSSCGKWKSSCQEDIPVMLKAIEARIAQYSEPAITDSEPAITADPIVTTELVETADGKWICGCGYKNRKHALECSACGTSKPLPQENKTVVQEVHEESTSQISEPVEIDVAPPAGVSAKGMWFCGKCGTLNENVLICGSCGAEKEE